MAGISYHVKTKLWQITNQQTIQTFKEKVCSPVFIPTAATSNKSYAHKYNIIYEYFLKGGSNRNFDS